MDEGSQSKTGKDPEQAVARASALGEAMAVHDWAGVARSVEGEIGLEVDDYLDRGRLHAKLNDWWKGSDPGAVALFLMALANSLNMQERFADMMVLLESVFGLREKGYHNQDELEARLREGRLSPEVPEVQSFLLVFLGGALGLNGRFAESVAVLRSALGVGASFDPREVRRRMDALLAAVRNGVIPAIRNGGVSLGSGIPAGVAFGEVGDIFGM